MVYNEARKRATEKYRNANYKRIPLDVPIEFYNTLKAHADAVGESVNGYIKSAVESRMNSEETET